MPIIILFALATLIFIGSVFDFHKQETSSVVSSQTHTTVSADNIIPSLPSILEIPSINLTTTIETLGKDQEGLQAVPAEGKSVGWYKYGTFPGEKGNAVLAGHYETTEGPGVFYNLDKLSEGDQLILYVSQKQKMTFEIYKIETVKTQDFDVESVYGKTEIRGLNLVTCYGKYDPAIKSYNKRLIIYSSLKQS